MTLKLLALLHQTLSTNTEMTHLMLKLVLLKILLTELVITQVLLVLLHQTLSTNTEMTLLMSNLNIPIQSTQQVTTKKLPNSQHQISFILIMNRFLK